MVTEHSLPAVHALHVLELAKRFGVEAPALFEGTGLREEDLADPEARISVRRMEQVIERARALSGEPALGVYYGMQMRASAHGYLGFAAMTASTVREALELAVRFAPMRTNAFAIRLAVEGGAASVIVEERADFGAARDAVVFALMIGIWQIGNALTGRELVGSADFAFAEPAYFARAGRPASRVRFSQPSNRLVFDAALLDLPLVMADPAALRLAREQCSRALDALGESGQLGARVRALIPLREGGVRSLEQVAAELAMSPRTLKRRLAAEGLTYSALADAERREKALLMLAASPEVSLEEVAERLGYSDVANFTRAFRRWTGATPATYRRRRGGS